MATETVYGDGCKNVNVTIEPVTGTYTLPEGPHWDHQSQKLFFVDIIGRKLCRLDVATGTVTSTKMDNADVGVIIPVDGQPNTFVAGVGKNFVLVKWNSADNNAKATTKVLATADTDVAYVRWNDGKADSAGRFWGGTMHHHPNGDIEPNKGSFYRIDNNAVLRKEFSDVTISNGIAWSCNDDVMYYIDSSTRKIVAFKFDSVLGTISDKTVTFELDKYDIPGLPDGMTIDTDGNLWVAVYGGGRVIKVDPKTGKLLCTVKIPAMNVTSVTFGGPLLDILYVTTSSFLLSEEDLKTLPNSGALFMVKGLDARGFIANNYKLDKKV